MSSTTPLHLNPVQSSTLYQRRLEQHGVKEIANYMSLENLSCRRCGDGFRSNEQILNSAGEVWHQECFVCAQCFRPFPDGIFYEFERRKYCQYDFQVLFAPTCAKCSEFIAGRVIRAMNNSWHPDCFCCESCRAVLADVGFLRNAGRALCPDCNMNEKAACVGKYVCHKCHSIIDEGHIKYKSEAYHPYHFNCKNCQSELTDTAREVKGELYCLKCHDKMGIPICGACRRPIEERVVTACGKNWHVEHFVCAKCEKPFLGTRHYERKGLAYCENHFYELFGNVCFKCCRVITADVFEALHKSWCGKCFSCSFCNKKMDHKVKFYELDMRPACKKCYEKLPNDMTKRLNAYHRIATAIKPEK